MSREEPYDVGYVECMAEDCPAKFRNHYWGHVRDGEGWFLSKDGEQIFCPDHLPEWVPAWRARMKERANG